MISAAITEAMTLEMMMRVEMTSFTGSSALGRPIRLPLGRRGQARFLMGVLRIDLTKT